MARVKIQVERGKGLTQTVVIDTSATVGATLGSNVFLNGQLATPAAVLAWLGNPGSGSGSAAGGRPLTASDDTNVTLTLGGYPTGALVSAASIAAGWTGQLSAPRGGTGFGSYTAGDLLYASGAAALAKLGIGTAGYTLRVSGGAPAWVAPAALTKADDTNVTLTLGGAPTTALLQAASLTLGWTGQLGVARGGSGAATLTGYLKGNGTAAFTAVSSVPWSDVSGTPTTLAGYGITDAQPLSSKLTAYAGGDTPSTFTLGIVDSTDAAAWRAAIGAGTSTVTPAALTKTDDTNVTLTLGGTPTTALLQATSVTAGWTGTLAKTRGGFGLDASTLTGYVKAAGAGAITASGTIPYTDLTGTPTIPTGANPSASFGVNLAGANGSASTFLRSDAVLKLDPSIAPTWTAAHRFIGPANLVEDQAYVSPGVFSGNPHLVFSSLGAFNEKVWGLRQVGSDFGYVIFPDDHSTFKDAISMSRSGYAMSALRYGNPTDNPPHTFYGQLVPNAQSLSTGASIPSIGANKPGSAVSLTPSTWWGIVVNGTQYYIPLWQ